MLHRKPILTLFSDVVKSDGVKGLWRGYALGGSFCPRPGLLLQRLCREPTRVTMREREQVARFRLCKV